jgi:ABC-type spermidine/putrescine transport system permease subunit I
MFFDEWMLLGYRAIAGIVALIMAWMMVRSKDWREQVSAALVFVPFVLRALGVK